MGRKKGTGSLQIEKNGLYTVRVAVGGRRFSRSAGTRDRVAAERFLARYLAHLGIVDGFALGDVWARYLASPRRRDLARSTLDAKRGIWLHFLHWLAENHIEITALDELTPIAVAEYLNIIRATLCAGTYNNRLCVLREICRVVAGDSFAADPWTGVRLLADDSLSRRELSLDEIRRLLAAAAQERALAEGEWQALFLLGIYTGLRLGDCCTLEWRNVDLPRGVIQLVPRKTRRCAHGRPVTIPIHPSLLRALSSLNPPSGCVHVLPHIAAAYARGRWRVSGPLRRIFARAEIETSVKIAGRRTLTPIATFHSLRHTFVSSAANAGVPLSAIASIVGHNSTAMTRHYYHENLPALSAAVNSLPDFF